MYGNFFAFGSVSSLQNIKLTYQLFHQKTTEFYIVFHYQNSFPVRIYHLFFHIGRHSRNFGFTVVSFQVGWNIYQKCCSYSYFAMHFYLSVMQRDIFFDHMQTNTGTCHTRNWLRLIKAVKYHIQVFFTDSTSCIGYFDSYEYLFIFFLRRYNR